MARAPTTKNGYNMYDMSSMLQKAIRRNDIPHASYAAKELYFGFRSMMWNRLLTVSAEDCFGIITREIAALHLADSIMNGKDSAENSYLKFVARAVTLLCMTRKSRDADYVACNYLWGNPKLSEEELLAYTGCADTDSSLPKRLVTKNGYAVDAMLTMLHVAVCQSDIPHASYAALELYPKCRKPIWSRLLAISDEDCYSVMTEEIAALCSADGKVNGKKSANLANLTFLAKAIVLLCMVRKNPNANYLSCNSLWTDPEMSKEEFLASIDSSIVEHLMANEFHFEIPEYVFDVHTYRGKKNGKTNLDFFIDENRALKPHQPGLFDNGSMGEYFSRSLATGYRAGEEYGRRWNEFMAGKETDPTHNGKDFPEF